jgi:hypothetical protein
MAEATSSVVKVSSRTGLAERWPDLIDIDAGRIATGNSTIEEVGWEIFRLIVDTQKLGSGCPQKGRSESGTRVENGEFTPSLRTALSAILDMSGAEPLRAAQCKLYAASRTQVGTIVGTVVNAQAPSATKQLAS